MLRTRSQQSESGAIRIPHSHGERGVVEEQQLSLMLRIAGRGRLREFVVEMELLSRGWLAGNFKSSVAG